jgi:hypothetical protein
VFVAAKFAGESHGVIDDRDSNGRLASVIHIGRLASLIHIGRLASVIDNHEL